MQQKDSKFKLEENKEQFYQEIGKLILKTDKACSTHRKLRDGNPDPEEVFFSLMMLIIPIGADSVELLLLLLSLMMFVFIHVLIPSHRGKLLFEKINI